MNELQVKDLKVTFGGLTAVSNVTFSVPAGQIFSIIGPNGAGKTTILNVISRIYDANQGSVHLREQDITRVSAHAIAGLGIARTFQNLELCNTLTVFENVLIGRHIHRGTSLWADMLRLPDVARAEVANRTKVEELLAEFELLPFQDSTVGSLPYGIRKQLELVRALAVNPSLLLLDEPAAGLNTTDSAVMAQRVRQLCERRGISVLIIEHDMAFVRKVSHSVLAMNYGRVIAEGTAEDVLNHPEVVEAYLGREDDK